MRDSPGTNSMTNARTAARLLDAVNRRDIGMVQRGENFGLALKPCQTLRVLSQGSGQNLDRHLAIELRVSGAIYLAQPAGPDGRKDFIETKAGSSGKGWAFEQF